MGQPLGVATVPLSAFLWQAGRRGPPDSRVADGHACLALHCCGTVLLPVPSATGSAVGGQQDLHQLQRRIQAAAGRGLQGTVGHGKAVRLPEQACKEACHALLFAQMAGEGGSLTLAAASG